MNIPPVLCECLYSKHSCGQLQYIDVLQLITVPLSAHLDTQPTQPTRKVSISITRSGGGWGMSLPFHVTSCSIHHCSSSNDSFYIALELRELLGLPLSSSLVAGTVDRLKHVDVSSGSGTSALCCRASLETSLGLSPLEIPRIGSAVLEWSVT